MSPRLREGRGVLGSYVSRSRADAGIGMFRPPMDCSPDTAPVTGAVAAARRSTSLANIIPSWATESSLDSVLTE
jgi:hypothetical protein